VGASIAVVLAFRKGIYKILEVLVILDFKSSDGKLTIYIILGTIPTAIIGIVFQKNFRNVFL
jgi:undecaprenyl pyrophosphate phosphatase UppP